MAHHSRLAKWLVQHGHTLKMEVQEKGWPKKWGSLLHDVQVTLEKDGVEFLGRSLKPQFENAFEVAGAEALERFFAFKCGLKNSSGAAVHLSHELASQNARLELIERDAFFCHYLTNTPGLKTAFGGSTENSQFIKQFADRGVDILFSQLIAPSGLCVLLCNAFGHKCDRPFGTILGLSCQLNAAAAFDHAFEEVLPNLVGWLDGELDAQAVVAADLLKMPKVTVKDHFNWGLSLEAGAHMKRFFNGTSLNLTSRALKDSEIVCETFAVEDLWIEVFKTAACEPPPLIFVRANHPNFQRAFFGSTRCESVNLKRLSEFAGALHIFEDLQHLPHPLG